MGEHVYLLEFDGDDDVDDGLLDVGVFAQRQSDVLGDGKRAEQRPGLEEDAEALPQRVTGGLTRGRQVEPSDRRQ